MKSNGRDKLLWILEHEGMPKTRRILATILTLSLPAVFEQMMITLVQYVDTAMVGSLGAAATAAIGLSASSSWLIGGLLNAAAVGFSVQVAQRVGARDYAGARAVTAQTVKFACIFGFVIGALAFAVSYPLPNWLGAAEEVAPAASVYFRIIACSVPFNCCALMLSAVLRCAGDTRTPMLLNFSINILNVAFNYLFIYPARSIALFGREIKIWGAGLGVAGAALGSFLSLFLVCAFFILVLYKKESPIKLGRGDSYRFTRPVLLSAWRLGLPVALERSMICVAQILITAIVTGLGTVAMAANYLAVTAEALSYLPACGVANAATTMVGQAVGAKRYDLARRFGRTINAIGILIMTCGGVLLYFFAPELIGLFSRDAGVINEGAQALRIVAFAEPFFAMSIVITGVLRGAGDTRAPFLISLATMWGIRITLALMLAGRMGLSGVWIAMAAELIARGLLFLTRLYRDRWLNARVI